jgi:hypothetical protein
LAKHNLPPTNAAAPQHKKPFFMIRFALIALAVQANLFVIAQNLVPNPSFEEYTECPQGTGELDAQVVGWESWSLTPDFFHPCNNAGLGVAGVPENAWGSQEPITGNAYAALFTFADYEENTREYIATELNAPLSQGVLYYLMFYVSMPETIEGLPGDGGGPDRQCATNNLGLRFFKDPDYGIFPPISNPFVPDNFAHLNYTELISDTINWTLIEGWFTADDEYNWVALGNFFTDQETNTALQPGSASCSGTYYIENVCVATSPEECEYLMNIEDQMTELSMVVHPNPTNGWVTLRLPNGMSFNVELYNYEGQLIKSFNQISNGDRINLAELNKGVYVLRVFNNISFNTLKLVLQ